MRELRGLLGDVYRAVELTLGRQGDDRPQSLDAGTEAGIERAIYRSVTARRGARLPKRTARGFRTSAAHSGVGVLSVEAQAKSVADVFRRSGRIASGSPSRFTLERGTAVDRAFRVVLSGWALADRARARAQGPGSC